MVQQKGLDSKTAQPAALCPLLPVRSDSELKENHTLQIRNHPSTPVVACKQKEEILLLRVLSADSFLLE